MGQNPVLIRAADGARDDRPAGEVGSCRRPEDTAAEVASRRAALAGEAEAAVRGSGLRRLSSQPISPGPLGLLRSACIPCRVCPLIEVLGE